jgi:hypothetical protein
VGELSWATLAPFASPALSAPFAQTLPTPPVLAEFPEGDPLPIGVPRLTLHLSCSSSASDVLQRLDLIGADGAEARALALLQNLGFSPELRARPMRALSGGWRVRTCLAAAIFARPDVLMLDEPTNHLSIGAVRGRGGEVAENALDNPSIGAVRGGADFPTFFGA